MSKFKTIYQFYKSLNSDDKNILNKYIKKDYVSNIRTGYGKRKNFFEEHNSPEGIIVVKEIIKIKKIESKIIETERKNKKQP